MKTPKTTRKPRYRFTEATVSLVALVRDLQPHVKVTKASAAVRHQMAAMLSVADKFPQLRTKKKVTP